MYKYIEWGKSFLERKTVTEHHQGDIVGGERPRFL